MADESIPAILRAEHLSRSVAGKILVEDADFTILSGETVALVGPSGSGKTSLLRLLNRLDEPTNGTVFLNGVDYRSIPSPDLRRNLGMVMQRPFLFPGTVESNLQFGPLQRGETLPSAQVSSLLAKVGLNGYESRNVANLSGGEAQRVSFARTLANSPTILLLDEPTSALDEASKLGVEDLIQEIIRQEGLTCILVTHDMGQAARIAQRALRLNSGRIIHDGSISQSLHA